MNLWQWLECAAAQLPEKESALLEARLFAERVLNIAPVRQRYRNPELTVPQIAQLNALLLRRARGEPFAYILGNQPFYHLDLKVSPAVLIPRPETEQLVDAALAKIPPQDCYRVIDLGTGSGAIALAIAAERPHCRVLAVDKSWDALRVAQENARHLQLANVHFVLSDWLTAIADARADMIVSNPPYIDAHDEHLAALAYEPQIALVSPEHGYADLLHLIAHAGRCLRPNGWLLLEHGNQQAQKLRAFAAEQSGWQHIHSLRDYAGWERITCMQCSM